MCGYVYRVCVVMRMYVYMMYSECTARLIRCRLCVYVLTGVIGLLLLLLAGGNVSVLCVCVLASVLLLLAIYSAAMKWWM